MRNTLTTTLIYLFLIIFGFTMIVPFIWMLPLR